ncbi:MAG: hypothetical protein OXG99_13510 [Alphaproteobacteria bacterium]|nr:hypothetical protein [Alphaproteobacteria bacterium]
MTAAAIRAAILAAALALAGCKAHLPALLAADLALAAGSAFLAAGDREASAEPAAPGGSQP